MKHDYTALDSAIQEALTNGAKTFRNIESYPKAKEAAEKIALAHNYGMDRWQRKDAWRFIDTRLQALRKKGHIVFIDQRRGWALKEQA